MNILKSQWKNNKMNVLEITSSVPKINMHLNFIVHSFRNYQSLNCMAKSNSYESICRKHSNCNNFNVEPVLPIFTHKIRVSFNCHVDDLMLQLSFIQCNYRKCKMTQSTVSKTWDKCKKKIMTNCIFTS